MNLAAVTLQNAPREVKAACDALIVIGGTVSTIAGWLPPIAALVSIVWGALNIYVLWRDKLKARRKP